MVRINFDNYFMKLCNTIAQRSTCPRKRIGALIVKNKKIISAGYNGAPSKMKHCNEEGCIIVNNHCIRTVHAEMNALLDAGKNAKNAVMYCNTLPFQNCLKLAIQAGIKEIKYESDYKNSEIEWILSERRILLTKLKKTDSGNSGNSGSIQYHQK